MELVNYYNLTALQHNQFVDFLIECSKEKSQPASVNMYQSDWENKTNTILYILNNTSRYKDNGMFNILFDNNNIVACSGCYTAEFSNEIAICGSRTWIHLNYRHKHIAREYLLPYEKSWATENKHKCIVLTFNEYNKNLAKLWIRTRLGEIRNKREEKHFGYNGVNFLDYPIIINHTSQYIIYEILDETFNFNWNLIK